MIWPPTQCLSCADRRYARCSSPWQGCPAPIRRTWSGAWQAGTGFPAHCAAPMPSHGQVRPQSACRPAAKLTYAGAECGTHP